MPALPMTAHAHRAKLLHVSIGGPILRSYFAGQLSFMRERGFEVVVAAQGGTDLDRLCSTERVRAHPVEVIRPLRPWNDLQTLRALLRIIDAERPEIIHAHTPKGALLGLLAGWLTHAPHRIYHLRALPLETQRGPARWLLYASELLVARLATRIVAISPSLRDRYHAWPALRRAPVTVLGAGSGNGVDATGRFNPARIAPQRLTDFRRTIGLPDDARAVCFVGRLATDKGLLELHQAWQELRRRYPDLWLILAGDEDERQAVDGSLLQAFRCDPRVCTPKFVDERELVFAAATLHVMPTYREGFGSVLLEAAAMATPSVASRVTGCVDAVLDGVTGTLVPPRSVPDLVEAISRYLEDPALCARHGAMARRRALDEFAPERIWSALYSCYIACLEQPPAVGPTSSTQPLTGAHGQFG